MRCKKVAGLPLALLSNCAMADAYMPLSVSDDSAGPYVHVRVGACDIAIPVADVWQALPWQNLNLFPRRSGPLLGTVDAMGTSVPVVALERWLPLETADDASLQRLLVLRHDGALVGIRVDAVLGVKTVPPGVVRKLHHAPDDNELFESVVPAAGPNRTLCILEVARLMQLSQVWCAEADVAPAAGVASSSTTTTQTPKTLRYAVFQIGSELWAVPVQALAQIVPVPTIELALGVRERAWAICQLQGRKLPLVDISAAHEASNSRDAPWTAILSQGPLSLGLSVSSCKQFVDLTEQEIASTPLEAVLAGVAMRSDLGKLQILDPAKLFNAVPLADISRSKDAGSAVSGRPSKTSALEPVPYLVFEADQRYASPVDGIVGVVELPQQARDDLRRLQWATLEWRGTTVTVVNLPAISRAPDGEDPQLAVLVQPPDAKSKPVGIAIKGLSDWLPAHTARRSGMRMGTIGEMSLIEASNIVGTAEDRAHGKATLVVVDLAQIAYLLG